MKKPILLLVLLTNFMVLQAQKSSVWKKINIDNIEESLKIKKTSYSERQQLFEINISQLRLNLANVKDRFSGLAGTLIEFPNSNGQLEKFLVWESSNFESLLQQQNPEIRAYIGKSVVDGATINFSLSPSGIQTFVSRPTDGSEFIEPYTKDNSIYVLFDSKTRTTARLPFNCSTADKAVNDEILNNNEVANRSNNQSYKTMRLALSCVGEYGTYHGGTFTAVLAAMNATMTRVNGVLEKDIALHLNIINNNNLIMYYNPATDPYSAVTGNSAPAGWNTELQNTLSTVISNDGYDIGHLFGQSGGGGNAGCIGCVCEDDDVANLTDENKGSAYTSPSDGISKGDNFDIDYVVHEMGHQLGGTHSFSFGGLSGNEVSPAGSEPGSGSTIMGYAGITNYNVQAHSDAYFTYRNLQEIQTNLQPKTCPVSIATQNIPPVVNAGLDYSIPSGTAYILKGTATDVDNDILTYCWEQNDVATSAQIGANCVVSPTKLRGPNYRSFNPSSSPNRYMPAINKVLAGNLSLASGWESVSTVARVSATGKLKFTLTVRDSNVSAIGGGQQTNSDSTVILSQAPYNAATATGAGPFQITSQNTTGVVWGAPGTNETITWDVNNTTTLSGSANVNIRLSIDGGTTFPYDLALNTPNDGSEIISVPTTPASLNCRLWIEPVDNIYYAVNAKPFYIGYSVTNLCNTYLSNTTPDNVTPFTLADNPATNPYKLIKFVTPALNISDVNITINATHPNIQNLRIDFSKPGGTLNNLYLQQCPGSANMNVTFDSQAAAFVCGSPTTGTYALPNTAQTLNALNGATVAGTWIFGFKDVVTGDVGTIDSITLEVCSQLVAPLAINNFEFNNFSLAPNPNNGSFKIQFDAIANNEINITVNDIQGRKIIERTFNNSGLFSEDILINNAQKGVYLVTIKNGEKKIVKKIIVE